MVSEKVQELCAVHTELQSEDVAVIMGYVDHLQSIADLTNSDIFINCLVKDADQAVIVAEAHPTNGWTLYRESTVGKIALPENEPGVFYTFRDGISFRDLRAVTLENISVRQDVVPIKNKAGQTIAVLIQEKDITDIIAHSKKYESMLRTNIRLQETLDIIDNNNSTPSIYSSNYSFVLLKEMNHRIKNNLQTIASILNLEARRSSKSEVKEILDKNVGRILTIAAIHDMLNKEEKLEKLMLKSLIQKIISNITEYITPTSCDISVTVGGVDIEASADIAVALALIVNELITNSLKHAFVGMSEGRIEIKIEKHGDRSSVTVSDNGIGFRQKTTNKASLGLRIVETTVREKIKGTMCIYEDQTRKGTSIRINF